MIARLKIPLEQKEYSALLELGAQELRDPVNQARFIIRRELERAGLLAAAKAKPEMEQK
jgi:hypothetical protein